MRGARPYFRLTVVPGHVRRARGLRPVGGSSISRRGGRRVADVARHPLRPRFATDTAAAIVIVVIVIASAAAAATAAVALEVVGAGPDVDVILGREAGAGRSAVGRVAGRVRALRRGEAYASGTAGCAGRRRHRRAVAAPVQPDTVHVLRRRVHRVYLRARRDSFEYAEVTSHLEFWSRLVIISLNAVDVT